MPARSIDLFCSKLAASMKDETITIEYQFRFRSGIEKTFTLRLKRPTLELIAVRKADLPEWTRLTHHQCSNCPLDPERHPHCPIAANLADLIEAFKDCLSTEEADITIRSESREYHKRSPVQYGVGSLMGLYMTVSGCPVMDKLRPMAYTHLPFATVEDTMFRAVSMYLLAQYFLSQRGKTPDWTLEKLVRIYEDIGVVNQCFAKRLLSINPKDASLNALVGLDCFATATAFSIVQDSLREIEPVFRAYLEETET
ncbi:MAG: hypothetical protein DME19_08610 [Verrucomicrobia bacterium]|nr:MAG: hypothetical protein DME19_08610 [Verrucomicrobiota bacterium]